MHMLDRVALDRLHLLHSVSGELASPAAVAATMVELARVGVRLDDAHALSEVAARTLPDVVRHVSSLRGGSGTWAPLFDGFPNRLPATDDVALRAALGWARLAGVPHADEADVRAAFDFSGLGWWPASSVPQDVEAAMAARMRQRVLPPDGRVEWWTLRVVSTVARDQELRAWMARCYATPTSLRDDVRSDLRQITAELGAGHVELTEVPFRETRTLLVRAVWESERASLPTLGLEPDDLLRLFADLTDTDVSLTRGVRYPRLSRSERRTVVQCLERSKRLGDVFRHRGIWLALGRGLHVGEHADAPRTRATFERLRATRHDSASFPSRFERLLRDDYAAAVRLAADEAPGVLLRALRRLASLAAADDARVTALVAGLRHAAPHVPVRLLLIARAQVRDNGATYPRVAVLKDGTPLPVDRAPGHLALPPGVRDALMAELSDAITAQLAAKGSWHGERVHVADGLDRVLVPEALRTTAQGLVQVERGTVLPLGNAAVVRLFVHWKHPHSDLDLSCLALDEDFTLVDHVSWTRLRSGVMVHSGDVTSAPAGAEEFLDIDLAALAQDELTREVEQVRERPGRWRRWLRAARLAKDPVRTSTWRYLVPVVFRYSGPAFTELEEVCAGWMLRDRPSNQHVAFDPAAVANAFALTTGKRAAVPFMLDLRTREVVYVDLYLPCVPRARAERDGASIGALVKAVVARRALRTDVAALVGEHVAARGGELVADRALATITVGTDPGCTYDALRPERLLADLL